MPGGQNPISLEYQIHPPTIDTLVTGVHLPTTYQPDQDNFVAPNPIWISAYLKFSKKDESKLQFIKIEFVFWFYLLADNKTKITLLLPDTFGLPGLGSGH